MNIIERIEKICKDLGIQYITHDSHGWYLEFTHKGKWFMVDPILDNVWDDGVLIKSYPKGCVAVRDRMHDAVTNPCYVALFDFNTPKGPEWLEIFLEREVRR